MIRNIRKPQGLYVGLRRAYESFQKRHGGVLGVSLIWHLRTIFRLFSWDFWTTDVILHFEDDGEVHMPGPGRAPTQNRDFSIPRKILPRMMAESTKLWIKF